LLLKRKHKIALAAILYLSVIYGLSRSSREVEQQFSSQTVVAARVQTESAPTVDPLYERLSEQRAANLVRQATDRTKMDRAAHQTPLTRARAVEGINAQWTHLLETHRATYEKLLHAAAAAPRGEVPCTICDGFSYMPCLLCKGHNRKCVTCGGTGHDVSDEFCPSCLGTGKCYLCSGSGKMFCPFCNDGMVDTHSHPPRKSPPID
jgi:hypothetical protein